MHTLAEKIKVNLRGHAYFWLDCARIKSGTGNPYGNSITDEAWEILRHGIRPPVIEPLNFGGNIIEFYLKSFVLNTRYGFF